MGEIEIRSEISVGQKVVLDGDVKNEPMLFSCNADAAWSLGGSLTRAFLDAMSADWLGAPDLIIDSRVHMLMPGWFPAIPGYHHDDVPRSGPDGQPNYVDPEYRSEHLMCLANADVCPTEFAVGTVNYPIPCGRVIYGDWHPRVIASVRRGDLQICAAPDRTLIRFDDRTFHQAVPAVKNGWRWFIRATRNTARKPTNELRRQVQVYLAAPMEGW
jgi:hypothetical protein